MFWFFATRTGKWAAFLFLVLVFLSNIHRSVPAVLFKVSVMEIADSTEMKGDGA